MLRVPGNLQPFLGVASAVLGFIAPLGVYRDLAAGGGPALVPSP